MKAGLKTAGFMSKSISLSRQHAVHDIYSTLLSQNLGAVADHFQRPRKLGLVQILLIMQSAHFRGSAFGGQSWDDAISDVGSKLGNRFGWGPLLLVSRQAFHAAVHKVRDDIIAQLEQSLASFRPPSAVVSALSQRHGIRFLHTDGTQLRTVRSKELIKALSLQTNGPNATAHYPLLNMVLMTEAGTNSVIAHQVTRCKDAKNYRGELPTNERAGWECLRGNMEKNDCIIADCGFASYDGFCEMIASGQLFMMGLPKAWLLTRSFRAKKKADSTFTFTIPQNSRGNKFLGKDIRIRIFTIRDESGAIKYIATNLFDSFTLSDCRSVYKTRWAIEVFFRNCKQHLAMRQLRSKTWGGIRLEIIAVLLFMQAMCLLQATIAVAVNGPIDLLSTFKHGYLKAKITLTSKAAWYAILAAIAPQIVDLTTESRRRFGNILARLKKYIPGRKYPRISHDPVGVYRPKRPGSRQRKALKEKAVMG